MNDTDLQDSRRRLIEDIRTYRHAQSMLKRKNVNRDTWDVAWWARRHLRERISNQLYWLGGLMEAW